MGKKLNPLESLERIKNAPTIYVGCGSDIYTRYPFECREIEKSLKALKIIKELLNLKVVEVLPNGSDTRLFVSCGNFKASILIPLAYIDLLKEVLIWKNYLKN